MTYSSQIALLAGAIDYAGTFPPAALTLEKAMERAATYRREGHHPWLLGKIALPLSDIKKLSAKWLYDLGADGSAWLFTALGAAQSDSPSEFATSMEFEIREALHWNRRWNESSLRQNIVAYEVKLPSAFSDLGGVSAASATIAPLLDRLAGLSSNIAPYFELGWEGDWKSRFGIVSDALAEWCDEHHDETWIPGIKIRTGGKYVPTMEQVAEAVFCCTSRGLKFKATQGLHAAITHDGVLGFVNLFFALALAGGLGTDGFSRDAIVKCLSEEKKTEFGFEKKALHWKHFGLDVEAVEASRRRHAACFGSCSLDEPDEFLAELLEKS